MTNSVSHTKTSLTFPYKVKVGGVLTDADSLPVITDVQKNGVNVASTGITVAQAQDATPANIVGVYNVTVDLTALGLAIGDDVTVSVESPVGSEAHSDSYSFTIVDHTGAQVTVEAG